MRSELGVASLAACAMVAACSFVTSFPDIEVVGGGNAGGNDGGGSEGGGGSGSGGNVPCVSDACQNCLTAAGTCPVPGNTVALVAPASEPGAFAATEVEVVDIVRKADGPRYVGNYRDTQLVGLETSAGTLRVGDQKIGFLLGPNGELLGGLGATNGDDTPSGTDTVLTSATVADEKLVVSGVFIGPRLVVSPSTIGTDIAGSITAPAPAPAGDFVPFVIWFTADGDLVDFALSPVDSGSELDNGYVTDVAALPGGGMPGRVAAIGYAARDPFGKGVDFGGIPRYYVMAATTNPSAEVALEKSACGDFSALDARRSSIAVDGSGRVWVAATGCPLGEQGADQSFITRFDSADLDGATTLTLDESPIGITEVAVSDTAVVVAGTYSGKPVATLESGDPIETGQAGDAFVMAFTREGWGNQSEPLWFRRIASSGGAAARVETLAVEGGRVFVGGRMGANGGIGDAEGCWAKAAPGRGRAFFAQLSEASGALDWLNVEGFEAADSEGIEQMFAVGMALAPVNGGLLTATGFHGELLLECGPDATNAVGKPEVWLRLFDLQ